MNTVLCKVWFSTTVGVDQRLLANMFAKLDIDSTAIPDEDGTLEMRVTADDWSALCVLEDLGALIVSQIG